MECISSTFWTFTDPEFQFCLSCLSKLWLSVGCTEWTDFRRMLKKWLVIDPTFSGGRVGTTLHRGSYWYLNHIRHALSYEYFHFSQNFLIFNLVFQFIFVFSIITYEDLRTEDYIYPKWSIHIGWMMTMSSLMCIPLYMVYMFIKTPGSWQEVHKKVDTN